MKEEPAIGLDVILMELMIKCFEEGPQWRPFNHFHPVTRRTLRRLKASGEFRFNGYVCEKECSWVEMVFHKITVGMPCLHRSGVCSAGSDSRLTAVEYRLINIIDPLERYIPEMPEEDARLMLELASKRIVALYQNWHYLPEEEDTAAAA